MKFIVIGYSEAQANSHRDAQPQKNGPLLGHNKGEFASRLEAQEFIQKFKDGLPQCAVHPADRWTLWIEDVE